MNGYRTDTFVGLNENASFYIGTDSTLSGVQHAVYTDNRKCHRGITLAGIVHGFPSVYVLHTTVLVYTCVPTYIYKSQKKTILHTHVHCSEGLFSFNIIRPVIDDRVDRNRNVLGADTWAEQCSICAVPTNCESPVFSDYEENKSRHYDTKQIILNLLYYNYHLRRKTNAVNK